MVVAALYVASGGCYYARPGIEPWGLPDRDARMYLGPHPVVAHPPCKRWGRYWFGGPTAKVKLKMGDDDGCFEAALASVRRWGGVLEHPEASHAWKRFGVNRPPREGSWVRADDQGGWTCCVEQGHYGHPARKATWLYYVGPGRPQELRWGPSSATARYDDGYHSAAERAAAKRSGAKPPARLTNRWRAATPPEFRDLLVSIAAMCHGYPGPK